MKKGGYRQLSHGFTMVEVLIVLAVTSSLLIVAMVIISGRLQRTEFAVGSRQIRQDIEKVFNEASSGFSGSRANFGCSGSTTGAAPFISASAKIQGRNSSCVFLGKVIVFGDYPIREGTLRVIPLAGNRVMNDAGRLRNVEGFNEARPTAIAPTEGDASIPDQSERLPLPSGFEFYRAWTVAPDTSPSSVFAVAVLAGVAGGEAQYFSTYGIDGWSPVEDMEGEVSAINAATSPSDSNYRKYDAIHLCFAHQGTKQSVELILGRDGGLGIQTEIREGTTC